MLGLEVSGLAVVLEPDAVVGLAVVVVAAVVVLAAVVVAGPALCADADTVGRPSASAASADMPSVRRDVLLRFLRTCRCLTVVMPNLLLVPTAPGTHEGEPGIRRQPERRRQEGFGSGVAGRQEVVTLQSLW